MRDFLVMSCYCDLQISCSRTDVVVKSIGALQWISLLTRGMTMVDGTLHSFFTSSDNCSSVFTGNSS